MLKTYTLGNLKAFEGPEEVEISPITLIYGPNSSGKSSLLQGLLLAKQTLEEAESSDTLLLPKGGLIDLGGFRELIHRHETSRPLTLRYSLEHDASGDSDDRHGFYTLARDLLRIGRFRRFAIEVSIGMAPETETLHLLQMQLFVGDGAPPLATFEPAALELLNNLRILPRRRASSSPLLRLARLNPEHEFFRRVWNQNEDELRELATAETIRRRRLLE